MKILHIVNSFSEGGVESLLLELLPRIANNGYQIDLLILNRHAIALKDNIEKKGINVIVGNYGNVYDPRNICLIKSYIKKYDAVHVHLFPTQLYAAIAKLLCKPRIPFFTSEHGSYNNRRNYKWFRHIDKWFYCKYDKLVAVSPTVKKSLQRWVNLDSVVICNGINLDRFQKNIEMQLQREELSFTSDDKIIIMVARFGLPKDHDTVIKALCHLGAEYKVIFVGSGERMEACRTLANKLNVDQRVRFIGNCTNPEYYTYISDVAVLCTDNEGLSISTIEYAAMGKPIIVSDVESMRDNFGDYVIMVEPHNDVELAQAITKIMDDRTLYRQLAEKSIICASKFDINNAAKQYCELYKK